MDLPFFPKREKRMETLSNPKILKLLASGKFHREYAPIFVDGLYLNKPKYLVFPRNAKNKHNFGEAGYSILGNGDAVFTAGFKGGVFFPYLSGHLIEVHSHPSTSIPYFSTGDIFAFFYHPHPPPIEMVVTDTGKSAVLFFHPKLIEMKYRDRKKFYNGLEASIYNEFKRILPKEIKDKAIFNTEMSPFMIAELRKFGLADIIGIKLKTESHNKAFKIPMREFMKVRRLSRYAKFNRFKPFDLIPYSPTETVLIIRQIINGKPSIKFYFIKSPTDKIELIKRSDKYYLIKTPDNKIRIDVDNKSLFEKHVALSSDKGISKRPSTKELPLFIKHNISFPRRKSYYIKMMAKEYAKWWLIGLLARASADLLQQLVNSGLFFHEYE